MNATRLVQDPFLSVLQEDPMRWEQFIRLLWDNAHATVDQHAGELKLDDELNLEAGALVLATSGVILQLHSGSHMVQAVRDVSAIHRRVVAVEVATVAFGIARNARYLTVTDGKIVIVKPGFGRFEALGLMPGQTLTAALHALMNWSTRARHHSYPEGGDKYFLGDRLASIPR